MGRGRWISVGAERKHRGEVTESKDGDAIPNLLLKHPYATFATYI
jgi:hypothetical protein